LDDEIAVKAALRRISVSTLIEEMLLRFLLHKSGTISSDPLEFPNNWDGVDLRERLIASKMRQKDLAILLNVHKNTLNNWVSGAVPWPNEILQLVKRALLEWNPDTQRAFRIGGRSSWS
jgi:hypothetical protein